MTTSLSTSRQQRPAPPDPTVDHVDGAHPPPDLSAQPFLARGPGRGQAEAERLLAEGLAREVLPGVLVAAGRPESRALRAEAVALLLPAVREPAPGRWAVGFGTALWVWTGWSPPDAADEVHLVVPPGRHRPPHGPVRRRQVRLASTDVALVCGVPVTTAVRTAADVARDLPAGQVPEALDRLARGTGIRPEDVLDGLTSMASARGVRTARALVREWADRW